ncbi:hypothetical protein GINT2_001194 [Glugoides intestinalis]
MMVPVKIEFLDECFTSPTSQNEEDIVDKKNKQESINHLKRIIEHNKKILEEESQWEPVHDEITFASAEMTCSDTSLSTDDFISKIESESIETAPVEASIFPKSADLIEDFTSFEERPKFLNIKQPSLIPVHIKHINIYNKKQLLFSKADQKFNEPVFRGPGKILPTRPHVVLSNSILSEDGVLYYVKVFTEDQKTVWYALKRFRTPELDLAKVTANDEALNAFIQSDIVDEVHRRSSYVLFNGIRAVGMIVGDCLCLCVGGKCIKAIRRRQIEKQGRLGLEVDGNSLEFSCELERNEWEKDLQ